MNMLTIAKKEIADAFKNKLFFLILAMLMLLIVVSVVLGAYQVKTNVDTYNQSVEFLKSVGKTEMPPPPNFNPLSASKSYANYIGLLGALLSIVLGNGAIVREKRSGTMKLILSRRVFRDTYLNGKVLGNLALLFSISVFTLIVTMAALLAISHAPLASDDVARLCMFFLVSFLYMTFFLVLGIFMAVLIRNGNKALLITVILWLILSFILPQIGDTMDMDNQLPGGFFASMGMSKADSQKILDKFKFYETLRDGIEEISPTKHYERAGFALLNVKPGFEANTAIEVMLIKWFDVSGLLAPSFILWLFAMMVFLRREDIFEE
jgi:ABC-2 type transport system permease protein